MQEIIADSCVYASIRAYTPIPHIPPFQKNTPTSDIIIEYNTIYHIFKPTLYSLLSNLPLNYTT